MESNFESTNGGMETAPSTEKASIWSIIIGIFTSPVEAFNKYKAAPRIIVPLVAVIILAAAAGGLMVGPNASVQYDMMKKSTILPPQVLEDMKTESENPNVGQAVLTGPLVLVIIGLLEALLAWFLGSVIFGGTAKYKAVWGVGILSALIFQLGALIKVPLVLAKDSIYVSLGLAAFFPDKDFTSIIYSFLYYLDAFAIWSIIVAGIGYAAVFGISRGKGMTVAAITNVVFICILIALTALGMSFAGVEMSFF